MMRLTFALLAFLITQIGGAHAGNLGPVMIQLYGTDIDNPGLFWTNIGGGSIGKKDTLTHADISDWSSATAGFGSGGGGGSGTITGVTAGVGLSGGGVSGTVTLNLATPTTGTIGGVEAVNAVSHQWISNINTSGVPILSQPSFGDLSGTASAAQGGTGVNAGTAANGSLLIGNGSGFSLAALTAGANITLTNSAGSITIASSGGGGSGATFGPDFTTSGSVVYLAQQTSHGDSAYSIQATDRYVATSAVLSAARIWTLPAAASVPAGTTISVADAKGGVTISNTLSITHNGSLDTIDQSTSPVIIASANGSLSFRSDGISNWTIAASSGGGGGSGTVTSLSIVSADGFSGTVANATATPAVTLGTTVTGIVKGSDGSIVAATAGTDFLAPNGNGSALTGLTWSQLSGTPSTFAGYGLTVPTANLLGGSGSALSSVAVGSGLTLSGGTLSATAPSTFTTSAQFHFPSATGTTLSNGTYNMIGWVPFTSGTLTAVKISVASGSSPVFTVAMAINGTPVTGCSAISVTSTGATAAACTGANALAAGNALTFVVSSASGTIVDPVIEAVFTRTFN